MLKLKEIFKNIPESDIFNILKYHDLNGAVEVLLADQKDISSDEETLPIIDLTVSFLHSTC